MPGSYFTRSDRLTVCMKLAHNALNGDHGKRSNRISASDCIEHLRHSVAKANPRCVHGIFFIIVIIIFILVIWHYWPDTVCTPDTMGTSESNATLAALVLHLMTLSPRGSFWHRRFPTIHCLLCVCSSSKGENNLEFNHISRSLTFGKRIMCARSR